MPRQPRSVLPDGMFHVTARAGFEQPLFKDDDDRRVFLNGGYAHYFNERHGRHGHVFGQRYTTRAVLEQHLERLYSYFEANPVEAGLCPPGERWPWMWFRPPVRASGQAEACP